MDNLGAGIFTVVLILAIVAGQAYLVDRYALRRSRHFRHLSRSQRWTKAFQSLDRHSIRYDWRAWAPLAVGVLISCAASVAGGPAMRVASIALLLVAAIVSYGVTVFRAIADVRSPRYRAKRRTPLPVRRDPDPAALPVENHGMGSHDPPADRRPWRQKRRRSRPRRT